MQTKKSQPSGQRIPALSVNPLVGISLSALDTDVRFYMFHRVLISVTFAFIFLCRNSIFTAGSCKIPLYYQPQISFPSLQFNFAKCCTSRVMKTKMSNIKSAEYLLHSIL